MIKDIKSGRWVWWSGPSPLSLPSPPLSQQVGRPFKIITRLPYARHFTVDPLLAFSQKSYFILVPVLQVRNRSSADTNEMGEPGCEPQSVSPFHDIKWGKCFIRPWMMASWEAAISDRVLPVSYRTVNFHNSKKTSCLGRLAGSGSMDR